MASLVTDGKILWLETPKRGTPVEWAPGTNYKLGDTIVPSASFTIPPEKVDVMFQVVGFVGKSGPTTPVFLPVVGQKVVDRDIEWVAILPGTNPPDLEEDEYYIIKRNVTIS